jgi:uncharacterized protein (TIGR02271 family)
MLELDEEENVKKKDVGDRRNRRLAESGDQKTIPVAEEWLEIGKRTVQTGTVRITKRVREREEEIDQPLLKQRVEVERVQVNRFVETAVPVRQQDGTTIIPILEEVLVVEKRLLLREELHIRTISEMLRHSQKVMLRSEEAEVEHLDSGPGSQH